MKKGYEVAIIEMAREFVQCCGNSKEHHNVLDQLVDFICFNDKTKKELAELWINLNTVSDV